MASDPVAKTMEDLHRTLKEIALSLKEQNRILKTIGQNYVETHRKPNEDLLPPLKDDEPVIVPPVEGEQPIRKRYGWSMAASVQREGDLNVGDQKVEQDDSLWNWTGETWERVELPSGEK